MTPVPPVDDELASALLDGEATATEQARVAADPALAARVEELRAVRQAVSASPIAPDPAQRSLAVAAALAVVDEGARSPVPEPPAPAAGPAVARWRRRPVWLAAAAAAVVLTGGLAAFAALNHDRVTHGDTELSTLAGSDAAATTGAPEQGSAPTSTAGHEAATGAGGAPAAPSPSDAIQSSAVADVGDAEALRQLLAATSGRDAAPVTLPCTGPAAGGAEQLLAVLWQGQPAVVVVLSGPPREAVVLAADSCQELARVPLT